jgi:uncharacterized membrane protein (TIGR01666 family)
MINLISQQKTIITRFFKSTDFSKALMTGIAIVLPILLGLYFDRFEVGLALTFGAFWSSPSDVSGSFKHKVLGILFSAILVTLVSFVGGYLHFETWLPLPILGGLTFVIAFISVYGFRASLISFSGLLALVLSFAHESENLAIYEYALLVGVGGLWYLSLSVIWYRLNPKAQTEEELEQTYLLTAKFLQIRGEMLGDVENRSGLISASQQLQAELIVHHDNLRELLIRSRKRSGRSKYTGKRMLVFVQLVEMLETAIANPLNYDKMDAMFRKHPVFVERFQSLIFEMARQLRVIAKAGKHVDRYPSNSTLTDCLDKVKKVIASIYQGEGGDDQEGRIMLQNLFEYQEKQVKKLKKIKWLLDKPSLDANDFIAHEDSKQFIVAQDYNLKLLFRNFTFRSTIFKHSLRLSVTLMGGYIIGTLFHFQNPYWILLTIIVIMRPSYGLTKSRSKDRIIGTLIGGAIASATVFLIQSSVVFGILGIINLIIALSMVQKNYRAGATFITLSVIFIYAIIQPDILTVIQYRIVDTLIGAGLSVMAMLWLWPVWGFLEINENIKSSISSNQQYLAQIVSYYQQKGKIPTSYRVSRKNAFVETANLSSAFQRMAQEPRSKQKNVDKVYEMVELNHTFLSSLSSLSIYIQQNPTTKASTMFMRATEKIAANLSAVMLYLDQPQTERMDLKVSNEKFIDEQYAELLQERGVFDEEGSSDERNQQEIQLVWEQLRWLYSLSNDMMRIAAKTVST